MTLHYSVYDRETANMIAWYHSENQANDLAADLYRANPQAKPGEFVIIKDDEECPEDCRTDDKP